MLTTETRQKIKKFVLLTLLVLGSAIAGGASVIAFFSYQISFNENTRYELFEKIKTIERLNGENICSESRIRVRYSENQKRLIRHSG
jgi:hypothetical protein